MTHGRPSTRAGRGQARGGLDLRRAWSLLETNPASARARFESAFQDHVSCRSRDIACIAWCGAVAARFHARDFSVDSILVGGLGRARGGHPELGGEVRAPLG